MANVVLSSIILAFPEIFSTIANAQPLDNRLANRPIDEPIRDKAQLYRAEPIDPNVGTQSTNNSFARKMFVEDSVTAPASVRFFPGLFYPSEVAEMTSTYECQLPTPSQVKQWALENSIERNSPGIYWLTPQTQHVGFANYIHLPSMEKAEYGSNVFQANLLLACNKTD